MQTRKFKVKVLKLRAWRQLRRPMIFRSLPVVGHPIPAAAVFRALAFGLSTPSSFLEKCWPGRATYAVSSGSAALVLALKALKRLSARREVVVPAYTCPSVLAAVIKAGLEPVLCDFSPRSFHMDLNCLESLLSGKTLAVIAVHLFGLPERIAALRDLARSRDAFLLEDGAQAFGNKVPATSCGASRAANAVGDFGDLSVFSFGRGKPLSLLTGGCLVVNNVDFVPAVQRFHQRLPAPAGETSILPYLLLLLTYALFFNPRLYWFPESLPWLRIGKTVFTLKIPLTKMDPFALRLGDMLLPEFGRIQRVRRALTASHIRSLNQLGVHFDFFPSLSKGIALLRFPLVFKKTEARDQALAEMKSQGLGASGIYPEPLHLQPGTASFLKPNGRYPHALKLSRSVLTLPLHANVREADIRKIASVLQKTLEG